MQLRCGEVECSKTIMHGMAGEYEALRFGPKIAAAIIFKKYYKKRNNVFSSTFVGRVEKNA